MERPSSAGHHFFLILLLLLLFIYFFFFAGRISILNQVGGSVVSENSPIIFRPSLTDRDLSNCFSRLSSIDYWRGGAGPLSGNIQHDPSRNT